MVSAQIRRLPAWILRLGRTIGWGNTLLFVVGRGLRQVTGGKVRITKYYLVAQPVPRRKEQYVPTRASKRIQVEIATLEHPLLRQSPRPWRVIESRFRAGATCFLARLNDEFAGFIWVQGDAFEEDEVRCQYQLVQEHEGLVWDFDVYVEPKYRLGRVFLELWTATNEYLGKRNVRWTVSRISAFKAASLTVHAKLGAKKLGWAAFFSLGSFQLSILSSSPWVHMSFSSRSRPVLRIMVPQTR